MSARSAELMRLVPHVYGAALAASRDERSAAGVTERVLKKAASETVIARDRLVESAILTAVRQAEDRLELFRPAPALDDS
jgi:hypothetical protein